MNFASRILAKPIPEDLPAPLGNYVAVAVRGDAGYVSGQFPIADGRLAYAGRLGYELDLRQGQAAAELSALNALGQIRKALGALDKVTIARIDGFIASASDFGEQPTVLNGASDVFADALGARGLHARTVFAVPRLPMNSPIELVVTFHLGA